MVVLVHEEAKPQPYQMSLSEELLTKSQGLDLDLGRLQLIKCSSNTHEDLNSNPSTHKESQVWWGMLVVLELGRQRQEDPQVHHQDSLAYWVTPPNQPERHK